jgi:hypothetical protein
MLPSQEAAQPECDNIVVDMAIIPAAPDTQTPVWVALLLRLFRTKISKPCRMNRW